MGLLGELPFSLQLSCFIGCVAVFPGTNWLWCLWTDWCLWEGVELISSFLVFGVRVCG